MTDFSPLLIAAVTDKQRVERDVDVAMETAHSCRLFASELRQMGFPTLAKWHSDNAKAAERWAVQRAKEAK